MIFLFCILSLPIMCQRRICTKSIQTTQHFISGYLNFIHYFKQNVQRIKLYYIPYYKIVSTLNIPYPIARFHIRMQPNDQKVMTKLAKLHH